MFVTFSQKIDDYGIITIKQFSINSLSIIEIRSCECFENIIDDECIVIYLDRDKVIERRVIGGVEEVTDMINKLY